MRYRTALLLPLPVPVVLQFLVDHVLRTGSPGELLHHLPSATAAALVEGGKAALDGPELLRRIRRGYVARGVPPAPKTALTREPLEALLAPCTDGLTGLRDRALLFFPFASGGQRRSEVASAMIENLQQADATTYLCRLTRSKTDQAGTERKRRP